MKWWIRIHDKATQQLMFKYLGFTEEGAKAQFGFLMDAFQFGAASRSWLGLDRLVAILGGQETIILLHSQNNSGGYDRCTINNAIIAIKELHIDLNLKIKRKTGNQLFY
jgi:aspartyl-tRNA synthetase